MARGNRKSFSLNPVTGDLPTGILSWESIEEEKRKKAAKRRGNQGNTGGGLSLLEAADPMLTMASAAAGAIPAGLSGMAVGGLEALRGGKDPAGDAARATQQATEDYTWKPRTQRGQKNLEAFAQGAGSLLQPLTDAQEWMGEKALDATGSPALATMAHMTPDILGTMLGLPASMKTGKKLSSLLDQIPEGAMKAGPGRHQGGMVAGMGAKELNPDMKALAMQMKEGGADNKAIWDATGSQFGQPAWFDDELNFKWEFDDSTATYSDKYDARSFDREIGAKDGRKKDVKRIKALHGKYDAKTSAEKAELGQLLEKEGMLQDYNTVEAYLDHPELYRNYPEAANVAFEEKQMGGGLLGEFDPRGKGRIAVNSTGLSTQLNESRSTTLHELNHVVQHQDGLPTGGNPQQFQAESMRERAKVAKWEKQRNDIEIEIIDTKGGAKPTPDIPKRVAKLMQDRKSLNDKIQNSQSLVNRDPLKAYYAIQGEKEARAVEARRDMTMDERLKRPFWFDFDTKGFPNADIYNYGD